MIRPTIGFVFVLSTVFACGEKSDDGQGSATTTGPESDTTGSETAATDSAAETGSPAQCGDSMDAGFFYDPPGACYNNAGCATCFCRTFRDTPPDPQATCESPDHEGLNITATVLEFPSQSPVAGVDVRFANAIDVATMGSDNAPAQAMATSDADGRLELQMVPKDSIGIVALLEVPSFVSCAVGIAQNDQPYEPANQIHDLYVVPQADIDAWNVELAKDPALVDWLPLGEAGGVVGMVRNRYTGQPVSGAQIVSFTSATRSTAEIRYLEEDGTFNATETSSTGVFVLLHPALAEQFEARVGGTVVSTRPNRAGSGPGGVFVMNLSADIDPGFDPFE